MKYLIVVMAAVVLSACQGKKLEIIKTEYKLNEMKKEDPNLRIFMDKIRFNERFNEESI